MRVLGKGAREGDSGMVPLQVVELDVVGVMRALDAPIQQGGARGNEAVPQSTSHKTNRGFWG